MYSIKKPGSNIITLLLNYTYTYYFRRQANKSSNLAKSISKLASLIDFNSIRSHARVSQNRPIIYIHVLKQIIVKLLLAD